MLTYNSYNLLKYLTVIYTIGWKMKLLKTILILSFMNAFIVYADEKSKWVDGIKLHGTKCTACHSTEVYSRSDRKIKSLDSLEIRVNACIKNAVKEEWSKEETSSVVEYLNKEFYKF